MSGGHYNYLFYQIQDTYEGEFENDVINEMFLDFCHLLKSLEWYKSDDTAQESYHADVEAFLNKWTKTDHSITSRNKEELKNKLISYLCSI